LAIPEGPNSAAGAPGLQDGFTGTFTSRYIDTGDLRQFADTIKLSPSTICRAPDPLGCVLVRVSDNDQVTQ
jgi:hypothetical protein